MDICVFCRIVNKELDSAVVWEDESFLAILDVNPNMRGMTLVMPKAHFDSYVFDMPDVVYQDFLLAARKVAGLLERALGVQRVAIVMEGLGINHAHIKLYPLYGLEEKFQEMWAKDRVYFDRYEGYLSTQLGPQADRLELKKLAEEIRSH